MVRAIVSRGMWFCVLVCLAFAGNSARAFAFAADSTSLTISAAKITTGNTYCDTTLTATHSCLGQQVTFTAVVLDGTASNHPTGRVDIFDGAVLIGSGTVYPLASDSSKLDFSTSLLTLGSHTTITATYTSDNTASFTSSSTAAPTTWTVDARETTTSVAPPGGGITVGTTGSISVSVADASPITLATYVTPIPSNYSRGTFQSPTPALALNAARYGHGAALLPNGSVFVAGGTDGTNALKTTEWINNGYVSGGDINHARAFTTATLLRDGTVLIAGGSSDTNCSLANAAGALDTAEIYDPNTGTSTDLGVNLTSKRCGHTATLLADGKVLIAGGYDETGALLKTTEVFDPAGPTFTAATDMGQARAGHVAVLLQDGSGSVLIAGGDAGGDAELFNVGGGTTSPTGSMNVKRMWFAGSIMLDGNVLVTGGIDTNSSTTVGSTEIYDVASGAFTLTSAANMTTPRSAFAAVAIPDGNIAVLGGLTTVAIGTIESYTSAYDPEPNVSLASGDTSDNVGATATQTASCNFTLSSTGTSTCNITVLPGHRNAGSHALTGSYTATTNHLASTDNTHPLTVNTTPLTITAKDQSKGYGTSHTFSTLDCSNTGADCTATGLINSDTVTVSFASTANSTGAAVGAYANDIVPSGAAVSPGDINDYAITYVNGTMTVTTAALTVAANNDSKNYGQTKTYGAGSTAFTHSALQNGDTIDSVTITDTNSGGPATAAANGTYALTPSAATGATFNASNYTITYVAGTLTVNPAALSVTANNDSKSYGQTKTYGSGSTAFVSSGLANSEIIGSVTITDTNSGGPATAAANGTYALTPSAATGGTFTASNYTITYHAGSLTVSPAALTVTANNDSKTYGQTKTYGAGSTAFSSIGLKNGETIGSVTVTDTNSGGPATAAANGSYALTPSAATGGTFTTSNYTVTYTAGTLTVNPAALSITANNDSKTYGQTRSYGASSIAFSSVGLKNGESIGTVTITDSNSGGLATAAANGSYALTPSAATGGTFTTSNYTITYNAGTLIVNPAPLTITAKDQAKVYGSAFTFAGNEFIASGLLNTDSVSSVTLSSAGALATAQFISPGPNFAITPSAAVGSGLSNYTITYVAGNMALSKAAAITVTAKNQAKVYGQAFTFAGTEFTTSGLLNTDAVTSATFASNGAAGTATFVAPGPAYSITPSAAVGTGLGNYLGVNYVNGTMTLSQAALGITARNQSKTYGDALTFTGTEFTTSGLANSDSVSAVTLSSSGTAATATFVSPGPAYAITPSAAVGSGLGNYTIAYTDGTLTLNQRPVTVTANNGTKIYGTVPSFAGTQGTGLGQFSVTNIANTDKVNSVSLASSGQIASANVVSGGYSILPTNPQGTGLGNYAITLTSGTLLVTQATPAMRAEQVSSKIDSTGGIVLTLKVFLFNSNAAGATQGTGVGTPTLTVDVFDGTTKLNSSPISLTANTTTGPCSSANQNCGSEASFVSAPIQVAAGTTHNINVAYTGDSNFSSRTVQVGALTGTASNTFASSNVPPSTSTSASVTIANPEPLLSGQTYTLKCKVYSTNTGVEQTSAICNPSSGTTAISLPGSVTIAVQTTTVTTTGELRMRGIYDLTFAVPAIILVGAGLPLAIKRRIKARKPLVWLGITLALVLCLVAAGCGGNGFANPNKVPVATSGAAQAGQYTVIITATDTGNSNSFDVATVPFTISQ